MNRTKLAIITAIAITAIVASMIITNAVGQTILFSHHFPKTPHG